jgi:hypothetical protein
LSELTLDNCWNRVLGVNGQGNPRPFQQRDSGWGQERGIAVCDAFYSRRSGAAHRTEPNRSDLPGERVGREGQILFDYLDFAEEGLRLPVPGLLRLFH